jgi:hypothetical protein
MDPLEALSGEPRKPGADETTPAPDAAHWLTNPTTHDDTPETGSEEWWQAFLLKAGKAMAAEDAEKCKRETK